MDLFLLMDVSQLIDPGMWRSNKNYSVAEFEGSAFLYCDVCANPSPTYQWYFNGTDEAFIIDGATNENYTVKVANDSSFGQYYCKVTNDVKAVTFPIELRELGKYFVFITAKTPVSLIDIKSY